jgi:hypothetical protein
MKTLPAETIRIDHVFIRGVAFRLEDRPAVGEGSDRL